jgi:hypothetical protein
MEVLQSVPNLLEIETTWRPHHEYPLWVSRPQVETDQVWHMDSPAVTGKNVVIAYLGTGMNQFYPMF